MKFAVVSLGNATSKFIERTASTGEVLPDDMSIYLCYSDIAVSKQFLYGLYITASFKQMSGGTYDNLRVFNKSPLLLRRSLRPF